MTAVAHPRRRPRDSVLSGHVTARTATVALCAVPILLLGAAAWHSRWMADDGFIYLRVVDNLHHGLGPVFNGGERIEVYTGPLWLALLWGTSSVLRGVALEWIAVVMGIVATLGGMVAAARGSWLLWRSMGRDSVGLPLGLLVVAAVRPMWDFATSGLETGLIFGWLGVSFWALAVLHFKPRPQPRAGWRGALPRVSPTSIALLVGLGPLVRPDLAIFSGGFVVALLAAPRVSGRAARIRLVLLTALLPVAYQLFRMGYFAALAPNTALAKEAGTADWGRGWAYFKDFVSPYYLVVPLSAMFGLAAYELRRAPRPPRRALLMALCPVVCAGLHALYIVRVGGDFMHGRMLLPSLFGVLLPVAVLIPRRWEGQVAVALLVVPWAAISITSLRAPYAGHATGGQFGDERAYYVQLAHRRNPVTIGDYRDMQWAQTGLTLRRVASQRRALVVQVPMWTPLQHVGSAEPAAGVRAAVVAGAGAIGILSYAAGPRVRIVDLLGLADPIASRTRLEAITLSNGQAKKERVRPGHDKFLPTEWLVARFGAPGTEALSGSAKSTRWVRAAKRALACAPTRHLLGAVTAPLTAGRFLSNIGDSFGLTSLRFSPDPERAAEELCRSHSG
jgi:arabinofuranosyltransferase